jgi:hypothetical protein
MKSVTHVVSIIFFMGHYFLRFPNLIILRTAIHNLPLIKTPYKGKGLEALYNKTHHPSLRGPEPSKGKSG